MVDEKKYYYSEIFHSIQGEGHYTGIPTAWIRFFLCNLQCSGFGQVDPTNPDTYELPFEDFDVNAVGTLNLLEATRQFCPDSPFVHMSTNKVYGDGPNEINLKEMDTRWDYDDPTYEKGISESFSIDQCKHSLFGASKVAAHKTQGGFSFFLY